LAPETAAVLLRALQQRWGHGTPMQQALLLLAQHMVHHQSPELGPCSAVSHEAQQALRDVLGSNWKQVFGSRKLVEVLQRHPEFVVERAWRGTDWAVRLNLGLLLPGGAAAVGGAAGAFPASSSAGTGVHHGAGTRPQLPAAAAAAGGPAFGVLAAVNAFWSTGRGIQKPFLRLAQHMALNPDPVLGPYSISSDRARQLLRSQLGTSWRQAAGYDQEDPLYEILEGEGGFVVTLHSLGWCFQLDLEMLLGRSRAAAVAASIVAAASSSNGASHNREDQGGQAWQQRSSSGVSSCGDDTDDDLLMLLGAASSGWMPQQQQQQQQQEQQQMPEHKDQASYQQQLTWLQQYINMQHQQQPHSRQQQLLEPMMMPAPHLQRQQQQQQQQEQQAQGRQTQPHQQRQLLAAIKERYAMQGGTDRVKAALACHLVKATGDSQTGQPPHSVLLPEVDRVLKGALGPGWMQRLGVTDAILQQLLLHEPVFAGVQMPDGHWVVQLQVGELLHWQQQQQQQQQQLAASQLLQQL
jgi:hypothetical protein